MRATANCPKCGKVLTTDCGGCIIAGTAWHKCKGDKEMDVIEVKWKTYPENEKELLDGARENKDFNVN